MSYLYCFLFLPKLFLTLKAEKTDHQLHTQYRIHSSKRSQVIHKIFFYSMYLALSSIFLH